MPQDGAAAVAPGGEPAADDRRSRELLAALRPRPVETVGDLLEHVPFRHDDFRESALLAELPIGEEATIVCTVESVRVRPTRRRNLVIVEARVRDESGPGVIVWFNQRYLARQLKPGMRLSVRGERRGSIGAEIVAKRHEILGSGDEPDPAHTSGLVPVYHSSEKLTSRRIADLVRAQLGHAGDAPDALPAAVREGRCGCRCGATRSSAPTGRARQEEAGDARRRLAFEELFLLQAGLIRHRRELERTTIARALGRPATLAERFLASLPFTAHGRPAAGDGRDRRRPRPQHADAAAAAGRRRRRQDAGGGARAAARGRARRPGGDDGAHRDAGHAAPAGHHASCASRWACG